MKKYNQNNFSRYKQDVKASQPKTKPFNEYTRDELIIKFLPLVENIARNFKDSDAANGVVSLSDRIQFGHIGLIKAVDKIVWKQILTSKDPERTIKSYLAKRIHEDDIYQCMLDLHDLGKKITMTQLALWLECSTRTIHRNMGEELKREKELLNKENEKTNI